MLDKYPLDFDLLRKGMWLETETLITALGMEPTDLRWRLEAMKLSAMITAKCGILVRHSGLRLRLMTDAEADVWLFEQAVGARDSLMRSMARGVLIDHSQLDDAERRRAESHARIIQATAIAADRALRKTKELEGLYEPNNVPRVDGPSDASIQDI